MELIPKNNDEFCPSWTFQIKSISENRFRLIYVARLKPGKILSVPCRSNYTI